MKNVIKLQNYFYLLVLEQAVQCVVDYYNNHRYHESLDNLTPAGVYFGRVDEMKRRREWIRERFFQMMGVENIQELNILSAKGKRIS